MDKLRALRRDMEAEALPVAHDLDRAERRRLVSGKAAERPLDRIRILFRSEHMGDRRGRIIERDGVAVIADLGLCLLYYAHQTAVQPVKAFVFLHMVHL